MANIISTINTSNTLTPAGTIQSNGLMFNPNVPRTSQAMGVQGSDGRGYTRTVGTNETVQGQLNTLLNDPNSRYLNQARAEAQRQAATRGLGNSSIAAGAGVRSAIQSALPIASQDASTWAGAAEQNVGVMNQNLMQERQIGNEQVLAANNAAAAAAAGAAGARQAQIDADMRRQLELQMQRERLAFEGEQRGMDRQQSLTEMGYEFNLRDMFANNDVGRDLTRMGAEFQWRDMFANNDAARQDWLSGNEFNRQFYGDMMGRFAGATLGGVTDMFNMLTAYSLDNPDVFNAADYQNFAGTVSGTMGQIISGLFAGIFGRGG